MLPPSSITSVETTLSLAVKPVINAVDILQSENPNGLKIGERKEPIIANKLLEASLTTLRRQSNDSKNHMIIEEINIIVKAFVTKSFSFPTLIEEQTLLLAYDNLKALEKMELDYL